MSNIVTTSSPNPVWPCPQVDVHMSAAREGRLDITASFPSSLATDNSLNSEMSHCGDLSLLTAVAVSALTAYDMCKASSKGMVIRNISIL